MMLISGFSSGRMQQQQHTHKTIKKRRKNKEQAKLQEHKHKNTKKNWATFEKNERKELRETTVEPIQDNVASNR